MITTFLVAVELSDHDFVMKIKSHPCNDIRNLDLLTMSDIEEENCLLQMGKPTQGTLDAVESASSEVVGTATTIDTSNHPWSIPFSINAIVTDPYDPWNIVYIILFVVVIFFAARIFIDILRVFFVHACSKIMKRAERTEIHVEEKITNSILNFRPMRDDKVS